MNSQYRPFIFFFILVTIFSGCSLPKFSLIPERGPLKETTLQGEGDQKVLVIDVNGVISDQPRQHLLQSRPSMVQEVVAQLQRAETDGHIKAVLLKINSPGGTVTASDILYHEISEFKKRTGVHIVVAMMNLAASGGYYISLPADWIMAHPTTVTGSIGVIFARPQVSGFMDKLGLAMEVNTSGEQKDMGSPFRPPTETERAIFQKLTDGMAGRFHDLVSTHRKLAPQQMEQVATARVFLADDAKNLGLVDQIGYLGDALDKAKALAGLPEDARVVTYRRRESEDDTIYNPSGSLQHGGISDSLGAMLPLLAPLSVGGEAGFYYIWPAAFGK
jgi:protease-4